MLHRSLLYLIISLGFLNAIQATALPQGSETGLNDPKTKEHDEVEATAPNVPTPRDLPSPDVGLQAREFEPVTLARRAAARPPPKKAPVKKAAPKKVAPKKVVPKKAAPKKVAPKNAPKAAPKKAPTKKAPVEAPAKKAPAKAKAVAKTKAVPKSTTAAKGKAVPKGKTVAKAAPKTKAVAKGTAAVPSKAVPKGAAKVSAAKATKTANGKAAVSPAPKCKRSGDGTTTEGGATTEDGTTTCALPVAKAQQPECATITSCEECVKEAACAFPKDTQKCVSKTTASSLSVVSEPGCALVDALQKTPKSVKDAVDELRKHIFTADGRITSGNHLESVFGKSFKEGKVKCKRAPNTLLGIVEYTDFTFPKSAQGLKRKTTFDDVTPVYTREDIVQMCQVAAGHTSDGQVVVPSPNGARVCIKFVSGRTCFPVNTEPTVSQTAAPGTAC